MRRIDEGVFAQTRSGSGPVGPTERDLDPIQAVRASSINLANEDCSMLKQRLTWRVIEMEEWLRWS